MSQILISISNLITDLRNNFPVFVIITLSYVIILAVPPGKDTFLVATESVQNVVIACFTFLLYYFSTWYNLRIIRLSRKYLNRPIEKNFSKGVKVHRLLSFNALAVVPIGILARYDVFNLSASALLIVWIFYNLSYLLFLNRKEKGNLKKNLYISSFFIFSLLNVAAVIFGVFYPRYGNRSDLLILYPENVFVIVFFAFTFCMLWVGQFFFESVSSDSGDSQSSSDFQSFKALLNSRNYSFLVRLYISFFRKTSFFLRIPKEELHRFLIFNIAVGSAVSLVFFAALDVDFARLLTPIPIFFFSAIFVNGLFNLLIVLDYKLKYHLMLFVFIGIFLFGFVQVYEIPTAQTCRHISDPRPSAESIASSLLSKSDSCKTYYVILADGGASRSAYWTVSVLAALDSIAHARNKPFRENIISIAGASGGALGCLAYYSFLKDNDRDSTPKHMRDKSLRQFFLQDHLSHLLARMIVSDYVLRFTSALLGDRAEALTSSLSTGSAEPYLGDLFNRNFHSLIDTNKDKRLPALFLTTTRLADGMPCYFSTVKINNSAIGLDSNRDLYSVLLRKGHDIRVVDAGVTSARFPYFTPAGYLLGNEYVDGGYFDNSGAGITNIFLSELEKSCTNCTYNIAVIRIINDKKKDAVEVSKTNAFFNDFISPLKALIGVYQSSTVVGNAILSSKSMVCTTHTISLFDSDTDIDYPMNWYISKSLHQRIDKRLKSLLKPELIDSLFGNCSSTSAAAR